MPTKRDSQAESSFMKNNWKTYLDRFGRKDFTLKTYTRPLNEDGYPEPVTIVETTIWGDLQYEPIKETQNTEGKQITADGAFYTLKSYTINEEDEIVHPSGSIWKVVSKIENEDVGTDKPYVGYGVKRLPKTTI